MTSASAYEQLLRAAREIVRVHADFTDAQLEAATHPGAGHVGGDLDFPISPELATFVLRMREIVRRFDEEDALHEG